MLPRPPGQPQLLLPARPLFIALTLVLALVLEMTPLGRHPGSPDLMALVLAVWCVHQPRHVGVGVAFAFGLAMDVQAAAVLGQHALGYTLLAHGAAMLHRRLPWFSLAQQAVQALPMFAAAHAASFAARMVAGGMAPGWAALAAPLAEAALWPLAVWLLQAPQRRPPDPDENRPL